MGGCKTMHRNIRAPIDPVYQVLSQAHGMMFICPRCFSWLARVILSPTDELQQTCSLFAMITAGTQTMSRGIECLRPEDVSGEA